MIKEDLEDIYGKVIILNNIGYIVLKLGEKVEV